MASVFTIFVWCAALITLSCSLSVEKSETRSIGAFYQLCSNFRFVETLSRKIFCLFCKGVDASCFNKTSTSTSTSSTTSTTTTSTPPSTSSPSSPSSPSTSPLPSTSSSSSSSSTTTTAATTTTETPAE